MQPEVSVIIVSWNGRQHLETSLTSVQAQPGVEVETIVVDNGSNDGTAAFVRSRFPWARLIALDVNRGFAGGNNVGAAAARGRYVAFLNNDGSINVKLESLPVAGDFQIRDYVPRDEVGTTLRGRNGHADDDAYAA